MSGMLGLFTGHSTYLVGLEDRPDGALKCYLGHRMHGRYVLVTDDEDKAEVRRAWATGQHVIVPVPPPELVLTDDGAHGSPGGTRRGESDDD